MDRELIQQILEIEKRAQAIYDAAVREAEQLPGRTEKEAQELVEKARSDAQAEAEQLIADARAQAKKESERILTEAEEEARHMEKMATSHFDRAVNYVLDRVAGKE